MLKRLLYNKFFLVFLLALVWLSFFDKNNLLYQRKLNTQIDGMKESKSFYQSEIEKLIKHQKELNSDRMHLEKYARERFLMKKKGETIFIIED
jgi:cell division protein DivIC